MNKETIEKATEIILKLESLVDYAILQLEEIKAKEALVGGLKA